MNNVEIKVIGDPPIKVYLPVDSERVKRPSKSLIDFSNTKGNEKVGTVLNIVV